MKGRVCRVSALSIAATIAIACEENPRTGGAARQAEAPSAASEAIVNEAVAVLRPTQGTAVSGSLTFAENGEFVAVRGEMAGLAPGEHGFHVHEWGNCDCPDGKCAGDHFAPSGMPHGAPSSDTRHVGDLGNVKADESGRATVTIDDPLIELSGPRSVVGRAVIVHAEPDDLTSQPSGNAGPRVACGVIGIAGTS